MFIIGLVVTGRNVRPTIILQCADLNTINYLYIFQFKLENEISKNKKKMGVLYI